jgi:hypothetical protein
MHRVIVGYDDTLSLHARTWSKLQRDDDATSFQFQVCSATQHGPVIASLASLLCCDYHSDTVSSHAGTCMPLKMYATSDINERPRFNFRCVLPPSMGQSLLFQHLWYAVAIILPVFVHMQAHVGLYRGMTHTIVTSGLVSTSGVLCHPAWASHCYIRIFGMLWLIL